jgi:hypothetical protein
MYTHRFASSLDRQHFLIDLIGNYAWQTDIGSGQLSFGSQHRWQIQLLATESDASDTWLWAWANTASNIPDHLLHASLALKAYGVQHGIPELTQPELLLDQIDGHTLALLASGICDADAYYRCPYDGGALYVLIMDDDFPECPDPPLQRVATVFPQAIAALDIPDHEEALCGYLDDYDLEHEHTGNQIIVRSESGEPVLTATFDEQKRLTGLEVKRDTQADGPDEDTAAERRPEASAPGAATPPENRPEACTPPESQPESNKTPASRPAGGTSAEGWDEGQLRRMLGG